MFHICTCLVCSRLWSAVYCGGWRCWGPGWGGPLTAISLPSPLDGKEGAPMCILLEGAAEPFWVWTDHKDLNYISSAKRLSSLQARWAFFFDRFCFPLSYRPGSKNIKPDALSCLFASPGREAPPDTISPRGVMVASVSWGVERRVREALWRSWEAALLVCLFQVRCFLRPLSGVILLGWSAIQVCKGRWLLFSTVRGCLLCLHPEQDF